jgi:Na+-transporting NADH:ubiquinone oxidoreductase subunit C
LAEGTGFWSRPNDDRLKTFVVAGLVAVASAVLVSSASVLLQPMQDAHIAAERQARMAAMLDEVPGLRDLMAETGVEELEMRTVDLAAGAFVEDEPGGDPVPIPAEQDVAGLGTRAPFASVYLVESGGEIALLALPVEGRGYQSTIRALLALEGDLTTIAALTILEQGDTPGLGAEIQTPRWQALWPGKEIADADGDIVISVVRGEASGPHEVDGITGATRTGNGVENMLRYWLGPHGYGPLLDRLAGEGA